jgi:hypothetical protein
MKRLTGWLAVFRASLKRELAAIEALGRAMVEIDIKRRARDRAIGIRYARHRNRLIKELDKIGVSEVAFCRTLGRGPFIIYDAPSHAFGASRELGPLRAQAARAWR